MTGWRVGPVRIAIASHVGGVHIGWRTRTGLVRGPWGLFRDGGEESGLGEVLRWNLTHTPSGRQVANCCTPAVGAAVASDLDALGIDWYAVTEHGLARDAVGGEDGLRAMAGVLMRWGADGQISVTDLIRRKACIAAGLSWEDEPTPRPAGAGGDGRAEVTG